MKKKLIRVFAFLFICIIISGSVGIEVLAFSPLAYSNSQPITPYADIIEWRYKVENGKLYKRQYNCTTDNWIGQWVLIN